VNSALCQAISQADDMRGVVSEPSSWQTLKQKVGENTVDSLGTLGRTPEDIEVYRAYRRQVRILSFLLSLYSAFATPNLRSHSCCSECEESGATMLACSSAWQRYYTNGAPRDV
jgi:hypothetical protein